MDPTWIYNMGKPPFPEISRSSFGPDEFWGMWRKRPRSTPRCFLCHFFGGIDSLAGSLASWWFQTLKLCTCAPPVWDNASPMTAFEYMRIESPKSTDFPVQLDQDLLLLHLAHWSQLSRRWSGSRAGASRWLGESRRDGSDLQDPNVSQERGFTTQESWCLPIPKKCWKKCWKSLDMFGWFYPGITSLNYLLALFKHSYLYGILWKILILDRLVFVSLAGAADLIEAASNS